MAKSKQTSNEKVHFRCANCKWIWETSEFKIEDDPESPWRPWAYFATCPKCGREAINPQPQTTKDALLELYSVVWYKNTLAAAQRTLIKNGLTDHQLNEAELVALRGWSADGVAINRATRQKILFTHLTSTVLCRH
jgi:hypothetical protein